MSDQERTLSIGAPKPDGWGPWVGVPKARQYVCAFQDCNRRGHARVCPYDGRYHHHGCIHYPKDERMRDGWCYVCDEHFDLLVAELKERGGGKYA